MELRDHRNEAPDRAAHREFLDRYYGLFHGVYDLTRRYYLLGREPALRRLLTERWDSLVEVGPGTGRNLKKLRDARPHARYGGVEASTAMLEHARGAVPWATLVEGFAEDADMKGLLGAPPDRILFSYCLSMVQEPMLALEHARRSLAPNGEVLVVDFGDLSGWPPPLDGVMKRFLDAFHVHTPPKEVEQHATWTVHGPGRYWIMMGFTAL